MLISLRKLDPETRQKCRQNGWVAFEPATGAYLRKSQPASAPGRPAQYIMVTHMSARVIWAPTDREAIAIANNGRK